MLSLGVSKGGVIPPTDEDRRRIIKQMKVRTTLKGDKSWIHHHNSDSEDETKSSPLSGRAAGGSPASKPSPPQSNRSPASKPQPGYLIRGVFTRTIDKTSSAPESSPNEAQKSCSSTPRGPSSARPSSGYRMTTEDYKKLAPYNIKQKSGDLEEEDVPFTPDEHKKRTEAANSVLRRSASRERAYVLSAAKKSNGSPTQEFPPMFAKRIEIEEEEGQQRRSPTVPGSCRLTPDAGSTNGLRKTTSGSSWSEPKPAAAASLSGSSWSEPKPAAVSLSGSSWSEPKPAAASPSGSSWSEPKPAAVSLSGSSWSEPKPAAVSLSGSSWSEPKPAAASPSGSSWSEPKPAAASPSGSSWSEPKPAAASPSGSSWSEPKPAAASPSSDQPPRAMPELFPRDELAPREMVVATNGSYPAHTEANNGFYSPKNQSGCRDSPPGKLLLPCETPQCLDKAKPEPARSSLQPDVPSPPTERAPVHLEDTEYSFKGAALGYQERSSSTPGSRNPSGEAPVCSEPSWSQAPCAQYFSPGGRWQEGTRVSEGSKPELGQAGSSSLPRESSITAPETQRAKEPDPCQDRITQVYEEQTQPSTESHPESPGGWRHSEPSPVAARSKPSSQESSVGGCEVQPPMMLHRDYSAPSHRIPAYVDSQVFSTRRAALDCEGSSRSESTSAWHCEFNPTPDRHDPFPRDATMSMSLRSHRVPFYMDTLNYNSSRLLSSSSERICSHSSPAGSGYHPDASVAGRGVLFLKEYVSPPGFPAAPRCGSLVDLTDLERATYGHHSYLSGAPLHRSSEPLCSYCGREIRDCPKIIIEHLNIYCHEYCFRCGICHKAMGDLLGKIFIHRDIVHCDKCYEKLF